MLQGFVSLSADMDNTLPLFYFKTVCQERETSNIYNTKIMETKINLAALEKFLSADITPTELASELDELAFYFSQIMVWLQRKKIEGAFIHHDADIFIFRLRQLRNVLLETAKNER